MAISYLRPADASRAAQRAHRRLIADSTVPSGGGGHPGRWIAGGLVLALVIAAGVLAYMFGTSKAKLTTSRTALAELKLPLGGATVEHLSVIAGREQNTVPVVRRGNQIWPKTQIPAHAPVTVEVTLKRPSSVSWLTGKTERLKLHFIAPSASLQKHYLTLPKTATQLTLPFKQPIKTFAYGTAGHMTRETFATPRSVITLKRPAEAGTIDVSAALYSWESAKSAPISYFPAGSGATAVASPAVGKQISSHTKITLTLNTTVQKALGKDLPQVNPAGSGSWKVVSSHELQFVPSGYGYGLGAHVTLGLPSSVHVVGGSPSWSVPNGSTTRLQQMLSQLGYLPFSLSSSGVSSSTSGAGSGVGSGADSSGVALNAEAQEKAAINPPKVSFNWKYGNIPAGLKSMWSGPGDAGTMTQGALMSFEYNNGLDPDGVAGPAVWKELIQDTISGKGGTSFGYTFVTVHEAGSGESESTWHNGDTKVTGAVNTGTAAAGGTATGVYPVFEHAPSVTMSGTNPDGSTYVDPGIRWVSYFNGGDALHEYPRGSYGYPQSDGCVEMPDSEAEAVYQYTPIGTLVDVTTD